MQAKKVDEGLANANEGPKPNTVQSPQTKRDNSSTQATILRSPRPLDDPEFIWPPLEEIKQGLGFTCAEPPTGYEQVDGLINVNNCIWIPGSANTLITRMMIVAHCGSNGHRGYHVMVKKNVSH